MLARIDYLGDGLRTSGGLATGGDEFDDGPRIGVDDDSACGQARIDVATKMNGLGVAQPELRSWGGRCG